MKKIIAILFLFLYSLSPAQDLSGKKVLIYCAPAKTDEKDIVERKIRHYKKLLLNMGAEVFTINKYEDKLSLSQLSAYVNKNNIDFVHNICMRNLIESEKENYSLVIYNEFEDADIEDAGKLILEGISNSSRIENNYLSDNSENELAGGFFFGMNSPGIISIDSKENLKAVKNNYKSDEYIKNEVWGYIRGLISYYEINPLKKGVIAGIARDKNEIIILDSEEVQKPVNNVRVTISPGSKSFIGDFYNNGFYYFDSLEPGDYKIKFEAGAYKIDSLDVTVASNQTAFGDILLEKDFSIPPSVFNSIPLDTTVQTDTEAGITIVFSIPMDQESTEEAFSIYPEIDGKFEWTNEDHILKFIPEYALDPASRYRVEIDTTAKGKNNIALNNKRDFYFDTKDYYVDVFHDNFSERKDSITTTQSLEFSFSKSMDSEETQDEFEIEPNVNGRFIWSEDFTKMTFIPSEAYETSTEYTVFIYEDAETLNGLELGRDYTSKFITRSSHIHPRVISTNPAGIEDTVYINSDISIEFNEPMKREYFYDAFSITPEIEGKFEWNEDNTVVSFLPDNLLIPDTEYKIGITDEAVNNFEIPLSNNFTFLFKTNSRARLQLLNNYPSGNQKNISTTSKIILEFNYPIAPQLLSQEVSLKNSGGKEYELDDFKLIQEGETFKVAADLMEELDYSSSYILTLSKNIKDELSIPLIDEVNIEFETEKEIELIGDLIEEFENTDDWIKPDSSDGSRDIDQNLSSFEINSDYNISGKYSGKISYGFRNNNGILSLEKSQPVSLFNSGGEGGLWIYGDLSNNLFALQLVKDNSELFEIIIDTVNWSGWKFKKFNISEFLSSDVSLKSILIKKTKQGSSQGYLYLDDLIISKISETEENLEKLPSEFSLEQNYPNPFNPTTTISFKIPQPAEVTLDVLNILGQKVRNLIHKENYSAGSWSVEWDGKSDYGEFMPSGVYLYKIRTADFTEVKKMILIK